MAINFPASPSIGDQVTSGSIVWKYDGEKWVTIRSLFDRGIISLGTESEAGLAILGDANTGIYSPGADQVAVTTNGTGRLFIDSSGNVGIGISTPSNFNSFANDLVIGNGSGTHGLAIYSGNTSSANIVFVDGTTGTDLNPAYISYNHFQNKLQFYVNYAESSDPRLVINSSGDVGIGTSSPVATLQVNQPTSDQSGAATILAIGSAYGTNKVIHSYMNTSNADKSLLYLENGSGVVMNVNGSGNVGIGTTSPGKLLSIQDSTAPSLALYTGSTIRAELKGTTALTTLLSYSNSPITFNIGGSAETEAVRIDGSGRVLIGTTTEGYAAYADNLTIADSGNCGMTIRSGTSNQGNIYFSDGTSGSDEYEGIIQYLHNDDAMAFGVNNGSERMRLDSSGRLLLNGGTDVRMEFGTTGTTGTNNRNHIRGDGSSLKYNTCSGGLHIFEQNGSERMRIDSSGTLTVGPQYDRLNVNPGSGSYDGDPTSVVIDGRTNDGSTTAFKIDRYDGSGSASTKFFINYAGQVGIGTASPQRDVHIHNSSSSTNTYLQLTSATTGTSSTDGFQLWAYGNGGNLNATIAQRENADLEFWTNNTEAMRLDSFGSLIIGDTVPDNTASYARNLIIGTTSGNNGMSIVSGTDSAGTINFSDGSGANATQGIIQYEHLSNFMRFYTADDERMRITSSGNVGIGTTAPSDTLHLDGSTGYGLKITDASSHIGVYRTHSDGAILKTASNHDLLFGTNDTEQMRIDSSGRLLFNTSSARTKYFNTTSYGSLVNFEGTSNSNRVFSFVHNDNSGGPMFVLGATGGSSAGNNDLVSSATTYGFFSFQGSDGTDLVEAARISAEADGTPGANDMPGKLLFYTTADGASSPTERMRITSDGFSKFSNSGSYAASIGYHEIWQSTNEQGLIGGCTHASFTENMFIGRVTRAATNAYNFIKLQSGYTADTEFILRGDGQAYADGSWNGGGADYAEYFEWSDSNTTEEDRRGISVVLDGDKIREATAGEEPIGVISGNPSVVGDADVDRWKGKYLRDDFGSYVWEDYEVVNDEGETVVQQRRKLNPDFNPDTEYVNRENRSEWDCVGLMGKLRIRKGQVTGSRWIKMRDISDSVEEWLVR